MSAKLDCDRVMLKHLLVFTRDITVDYYAYIILISSSLALLLQWSPLNSNPLKTNFRLIQILSNSLHRANT